MVACKVMGVRQGKPLLGLKGGVPTQSDFRTPVPPARSSFSLQATFRFDSDIPREAGSCFLLLSSFLIIGHLKTVVAHLEEHGMKAWKSILQVQTKAAS